MNINEKILLGVVTLGLALPAFADQCPIPYVGVDAKWGEMKFKNRTGKDVMAKNYPQGNLFAGLKFNEFSAFELGYSRTFARTRSSEVLPRADFFGLFNPGFAPLRTRTKTKIEGFNANLVGSYPISEEYSISLLGSVGLAYLRLQSQIQFYDVTNPTDVTALSFVKRKMVPRASLGVQHMFSERLGVRAMLGWEKTSAFGKISPVEASNRRLSISPKNTKSIGLGLFYSFS